MLSAPLCQFIRRKRPFVAEAYLDGNANFAPGANIGVSMSVRQNFTGSYESRPVAPMSSPVM